MRTHSFSAVKNQQLHHFLRATGLCLLFALLIASCGDCGTSNRRNKKSPTEYAQTVCDCVNNASGRATDIAKCYQTARDLRDRNLHTKEAKEKFNEVALECAAAGVVDMAMGYLK
jgi:hypothetical protein